jgi:hypothetical protein
MVKQYQENSSHAVDLNFVSGGKAFGVDGTGNAVNYRHGDGKNVKGKIPQGKYGVGGAEIADKEERHPLEGPQIGKVGICGDEKRYLDKDPYGTAEGIDGMIMVLPVERGEDHVLIIAPENGFYPVTLRLESFDGIPFHLLPFFRHDVQGQAQDGNGKTDADDGYGGFFEYLVNKDIGNLNDLYNGKDKDGVKHLHHSISGRDWAKS